MSEQPVAEVARGPYTVLNKWVSTVKGQAAATFLAALAVFVISASVFGSLDTPGTAYFQELASAFLHGRLDFTPAVTTQDLTMFEGHWYVPFPPLAALLMVPLVLVFGTGSFSTVVFCAAFGAANVCLIFLILVGLSHRGWVSLKRSTITWLTALFGIGSVHWSMAVTGSVWFLGQVCAFTFAALAVAIAIWTPWRIAAWLSGAALGLAALGRPDLVLTWPLIFGIALQRYRDNPAADANSTDDGRPQVKQPRLLEWGVFSLVPLVAAGLLLATYNGLRFGDPFDFGYLSENVGPDFRMRLAKYGQFNLHYLPQNLWAMLLAGPELNETLGVIRPDPRGMSVLLTTPAMLFLWRARGSSALIRGAWIALVLLLVPILLYYTTGWIQFGYRFSLELMIPVMALLAVAVRSGETLSFRLLVSLGIVINAAGTIWWLSM